MRKGDVSEELEALQKAAQDERETGRASYRELFTKPGLRKRVAIASFLQVAQQMTGINCVGTNLTDIFKAAGTPAHKVNWIPTGPAFIYSCVGIVSCIIGIAIIEKVGRRSMLLFATAVMAPALLVVALSNTLDPNQDVQFLGLTQEVGIFIFQFTFAGFWGSLPWVYPSEIFANHEREPALSVCTGMQYFMNFLMVLIGNMLLRVTPSLMFWVFGGLGFVNLLFVAVCIKETKGLAIDDVIAAFDGGSKDEKKTPFV